MKSQERHDLKKNELAESLEKIQKFFQEHGSRILAIALVVIVAMAVISYVRHTNEVARQQAMEQLLSLNSGQAPGQKPEDIQAIAQQTSDSKIAALAWKLYGDALYNQYITSNKNAQDLLGQAEKAYQTVSSQYPAETLAVAGARMGLAAVYENQGKWADARKIYQDISGNTELKGSGLSKIAQSRLSALETLEKSAKQPLATTQPTNISSKPATSSTSTLAK